VYFPPEILRQLIDLSDGKKIFRSSIVEAAVTSFLRKRMGRGDVSAITSATSRGPADSIQFWFDIVLVVVLGAVPPSSDTWM
jgi:hypothetical protein